MHMSSQVLNKPLPYLGLIVAHLIWAINFLVAKVTLQEFPPGSLAFLRFAMATLLVLPFFIIHRKKINIDTKDWPTLVSIGLLIVTFNISFFFEGISKSSVTNASVLTLIIPILSVLLGWIFLKEKVYIINIFGIICGLTGALITIRIPQIFIGTYSPSELIGNILIILSSLCWVGGSILSRKMLEKYPSLVVTTISFIVGTVTFLIPALMEYTQNPGWVSKISMLGFLGLMYMTFLSSVSAYFLFEWGLAKVGVVKANLLHYIEPIIAAFLAITILGEQVSFPFIIGSILIIASVYLGTLAKRHHLHHRKTHRN